MGLAVFISLSVGPEPKQMHANEVPESLVVGYDFIIYFFMFFD